MDQDRKPFAEPVEISLDGETREIADTVAARDLLMSTDWPGPRDAAHDAALDACLKVLDGHRSVVDARDAFLAAAGQAGLAR